ncbi:MAG: hypothetical protein EPN97_04375 [Alphaproteobacteria bacterium]|nr:MAG: hypothetical protein EPN97_04375 [Alphaproteobacteria bacterium]
MNKREWAPYDKEISKVFNRFAGKIVNPANPEDPVLEAMRLEAHMHYSYLRLVAPGTEREENSEKITRINAELEDAGNGKWRIGNRFFRG